MESNTNNLILSVEKKNPKPDAPTYEIRTIEELFKILTKENYKRFLEDFSASVEFYVNTQGLYRSVVKSRLQKELPENPLSADCFTWIDD